MAETIADRVEALLADADEESGGLGSLADEEDPRSAVEDSGLLETAREASELIEEETAEDLLAALDLDELEDGTEPESLPEAIALGSEELVDELRALVKLAKIASVDDAELDDEVDGLRAALDAGGEHTEDEEGGSTEESAENDEESLAESAADAVEGALGGDDDDSDGLLEEAVRSRLEGFGDELEETRASLESLRGDDDEESAEDDPEADPEAEEPEEESSPLGTDDGARSQGTMHSTVAPSPSKRADMSLSTRHSTMPKR